MGTPMTNFRLFRGFTPRSPHFCTTMVDFHRGVVSRQLKKLLRFQDRIHLGGQIRRLRSQRFRNLECGHTCAWLAHSRSRNTLGLHAALREAPVVNGLDQDSPKSHYRQNRSEQCRMRRRDNLPEFGVINLASARQTWPRSSTRQLWLDARLPITTRCSREPSHTLEKTPPSRDVRYTCRRRPSSCAS